MPPQRRIYVGNLPSDVRQDEIRDLFKKYGPVDLIDIKVKSGGPPFAFVDFEDERDAEDAVRGRDGYDWDGCRLRVEFPRGVGPRGPGGVPISELDRDGGRRYSSYGRPRQPPPRRSNYRVIVTGLPPSGSWQDLKDHLRNAGEIYYADVFRDGKGAVEFATYEDMKRAIRKFDDTKFRSHEGESAYIRLAEDRASSRSPRGGRGGRSRSRSRSRSPPPRRERRERSVSRSRSPRDRSRSYSR